MADKVFGVDPLSGITSFWHYDEATDTALIEKRQDVSDIVEANKSEFNEDHGRYGEWAKVASIPLSVYYDLKAKGIVDDPVAMKRWLNDADNRAFRTRPGTV
jgi:hypothetical protein